MSAGAGVLAQLRTQPGGEQLLALADAGAEAALVGGAVRDLLLERPPRELDVVVAGDAPRFAGELARLLEEAGSGAVSVEAHERFGTASVKWGGGWVDIATRRAESYPQPGVLPQVRAGTIAEDLARRDFTVNALAVPLAGEHASELLGADHALEDLGASRLRVLHERSFIDDPTRLLRLARYRARLGFAVEPHTARLAADALAGGALSTVSGARVGAELRLALAEADAPGALSSLEELGVLGALVPALGFDSTLAAPALALLESGTEEQGLLLACLVLDAVSRDGADAARALLDALEFSARERDVALSSAAHAVTLATQLGLALRPSQLHSLLASQPVEAVALAGALGEHSGSARAAGQARQWIGELRHVRLAISGDDLLAAGLAPGPQIGRRLDAALCSKLDGELPDEDRRAELRAALEASV